MTGTGESPRVLDLTGPLAIYGTRLMADLGADVIRVEDPAGDSIRRSPPFAGDVPDPEKSLAHLSFNTNKRSVTLDLRSARGQEIFRRLVKTADILVETFSPGYLETLDLGYAALREINPGLIMASVTPFGQTGPSAAWEASEITLWAMSGLMSITGDSNGPPVLAAQGYLVTGVAGLYTAIGSYLGLLARRLTGEGQHVDVSAQEALASTMVQGLVEYLFNQRITGRMGAKHGHIAVAGNYTCKDGFWSLSIGSAEHWHRLVEWIGDQELATNPALADEPERYRVRHLVNEKIEAWARQQTRAELVAEGQARQLPVASINTAADLVADPQLGARGYFVAVDHPTLGTFRVPGLVTDVLNRPRFRPAPLLGQHNEEVYGEIGLSQEAVQGLREAGII